MRYGPVVDQIFVFPQNSYVETLTPAVIVFGDGAFGRSLGLDEVMRVGSS